MHANVPVDDPQLLDDHHHHGGHPLLLNGGNNRIDEVLTSIQPVRDLAKNWDIDIASWYVVQWCAVIALCLRNVEVYQYTSPAYTRTYSLLLVSMTFCKN